MRLLLIYSIFAAILMTFGLQLVLWTASLVQKGWRCSKRCFSLGFMLAAFVSWMMAEEGGVRGPMLFSLATLFSVANALSSIEENYSLLRVFLLSLELLALTLPFTLISIDLSPTISVLSFCGASLVALCSTLLIVAKRQKRRFESNPLNRNKICREGLWRRSCDIDLVYEWIVYAGFTLYLFQSPFGYAACIPLLLKSVLILMQKKKRLVIKGAVHYQKGQQEVNLSILGL